MAQPLTDFVKVPTTGTIKLPPDPRSIESLGRHHSLEAALAELVDNSIDAGARNIHIRFVREGARLSRLYVVDDGRGMTSKQIDIAMTVGGSRTYRDDEIGKFGLGLKSASFSQAREFTVLSRTRARPAVGRRLRVAKAKQDFSCEIVDPTYARELLTRDWGFPRSRSGTIVRWDDVKGFPAVDDAEETDRFLLGAIGRIRRELGLIFHRILATGRPEIVIETEDAELDDSFLLSVSVEPLDPFGYRASGAPGWPKTLSTRRASPRLKLGCHIWPGRSTLDEYRLDGDLLNRQGFFVYYNDRLIQRGGWNGLIHTDKKLNLARVSLDIPGDIDGVVSLKPEKNGVEAGPRFPEMVLNARARDRTSFREYLDTAREILVESNRRRRLRSAVLPPGTGFDPRLRRAIARELPLKDDDDFQIRWDRFEGDELFEIDRESCTLWLNKKYRRALLGGRHGGLNDLPVTKALLFLVFENIFAGQNIGPRDRDNLELWQAILTAAAQAEAS